MIQLEDDPCLVEVVGGVGVVVATSYRLFFIPAFRLHEHLSTRMCLEGPEMLRWGEEREEVLLGSQKGVQLYWSDWQRHIQMRLVVHFAGDILYSIEPLGSSWLCFGQFGEYGTGPVRLQTCQAAAQHHQHCFVGSVQYILTPQSLLTLNHFTQTLTRIGPLPTSPPFTFPNFAGIALQEGALLRVGSELWRVSGERLEWGVEVRGEIVMGREVVGWRREGSVDWWAVERWGLRWLCRSAAQGAVLRATIDQQVLMQLTCQLQRLLVQTIPLPQRHKVTLQALVRLDSFSQEEVGRLLEEVGDKGERRQLPQQQEQKYNCEQPVKQPEVYLNARLETNEPAMDFPSLGQSAISLRSTSRRHSVTNKPLRISGFAPSSQEGDFAVLEQLIPIAPRSQSQIDIETPMFSSPQEFKNFDGSGFIIPDPQVIAQEPNSQVEKSNTLSAEEKSGRSDSARINFEQLSKKGWEESRSSEGEQEEVLEEIDFSQIQTDTGFKLQQTSGQHASSLDASPQKYCKMLNSLYRQQPEMFQGALQDAMPYLIHEPQARILLAEHICSTNSQACKDSILRLFRNITDSPQNRSLMLAALAEFRIEEVPFAVLPFTQDFCNILLALYPEAYLQDLMAPSLKLYDKLVENYLSKDLKKMKVWIEGQPIELGPPRNLLNLLLYLNETCNLPMEGLFEVYCRRLMRARHISTLAGLLQRKVLSMCGLEEDFMSGVAEGVIREWVEEEAVDSKDLELLLSFMTSSQRRKFEEVLNLIDCFNICTISYDRADLFSLQHVPSLLPFFQRLLHQNQSLALSALALPSLLTTIHRLRTGRSPRYYSSEQISITQLFATNSMKGGFFSEAMVTLLPIAPALSRGFVAKLLFKQMNGCYANRLVTAPTPLSSTVLEETFPELISAWHSESVPDVQPTVPDKESIDWESFRCRVEERMGMGWELAYILYQDLDLAHEIMEQGVVDAQEFYDFEELLGYSLLQLKEMRFKKQEQPVVIMFENDSQAYSGNEEEINQSYLAAEASQPSSKSRPRKKEKIKQHSLGGFSLNEPQGASILTQSAAKAPSQNDIDPTLMLLKLQVERDVILKTLRQVYEGETTEQFIRTVNVVDRQRVGLIYWENFKTLCFSGIQYPLQRIIPFEYLTQGSASWTIAEKYFIQYLTSENFWLLYLIGDIAFGAGGKIVVMFIGRVIQYLQDDRWAVAIQGILKQVSVDRQEILMLASQALAKGLTDLQKVLLE